MEIEDGLKQIQMAVGTHQLIVGIKLVLKGLWIYWIGVKMPKLQLLPYGCYQMII
jgi:hypothetical protein